MDAKGEEGILLGCSIRSKTNRSSNTNTSKILERINVKVDEYSKLNEEIQVQEPEDYKTFIYYYEGMPTREPKIPSIEEVSITVESHPIIAKSHSDTEV